MSPIGCGKTYVLSGQNLIKSQGPGPVLWVVFKMAGMALLLSFKVGAPNVCDVVGSALWHIAPAFSHGVGWTGSAQTHPNAFLTVTYDDVSPLFQPLANSSGIFIAFHEGQKQISNPPLCPPSSPLLHNSVTPAEMYKTYFLPLIYALTIRNKLLACQRKYDGPKMRHADHCQGDWLKLLQHHHFYYFIQVGEFQRLKVCKQIGI